MVKSLFSSISVLNGTEPRSVLESHPSVMVRKVSLITFVYFNTTLLISIP